jgi:hypothetical protein
VNSTGTGPGRRENVTLWEEKFFFNISEIAIRRNC